MLLIKFGIKKIDWKCEWKYEKIDSELIFILFAIIHTKRKIFSGANFGFLYIQTNLTSLKHPILASKSFALNL